MKAFILIISVLFISCLVYGQEKEDSTQVTKISDNKSSKADKNHYFEWDVDDVYSGRIEQDRSELKDDYQMNSDEPEYKEERKRRHLSHAAVDLILNIGLALLWIAAYY